MGPPAYNAEHVVGPDVSTDRVLNNTTFTLHNLPDISKPPQVVGLLTVPPKWAGPDHLGYQVSDFLAFKALFHGVGHKDAQIWLSSLKVEDVMKQTGATYAHGDTVQPDDTKLGKDVAKVLDSGSVNFIEDSKSLFDRFMTEVGNRSGNGRQLIIIVCGETTPEQTIIFDCPTKLTATKADLQQKLTPGCTVTMVSPALFSGGYTVNLFLGDKPSLPLSPDIMTEVLARHCGGAFIDNMIRHLTCRYSPLLSKEERDLDLPNDLSQMPRMTKDQEDLYYFFHLGVRRVLSSRLSKFPARHSFEWDECNDEWPLGERVGAKIDFWREKWNRLGDVPIDAKEDGYVFLSGAFGGSKSSQLTHIKHMVKQELESCTGDWSLPAYEVTRKTFTSFLESTNVSEARCIDVFGMIEYRSSAMLLADVAIDVLDLPRPGEVPCRDWDLDVYKAAEIPGSSMAKARTNAFAALNDRVLPKTPVPPCQNRDKLSRANFWRPAFYLSAAIAMKVTQEKKDPSMAIEIAHRDVYRVFEAIFRKQIDLVVKHPGVMSLGKDWIQNLDLQNLSSRASGSLSPSVGIEGSRHAAGSNTFDPYYWGLVVPKEDRIAQESPPVGGDKTAQPKVARSEEHKAFVLEVATEKPHVKSPLESRPQVSTKPEQDKLITPLEKPSTSRMTTGENSVPAFAQSPPTPAIIVSPPTSGQSPAKTKVVASTIVTKAQPSPEHAHLPTTVTIGGLDIPMQRADREKESPKRATIPGINQSTTMESKVVPMQTKPTTPEKTETVTPGPLGPDHGQLFAQIMQIGSGEGLSESAARDIMALFTKRCEDDKGSATSSVAGSPAGSAGSLGADVHPVTPTKPGKPPASVSSGGEEKASTGWEPLPDNNETKEIIFEEDIRRRAWRTAVKDKDIKMADEAAKNGKTTQGFEVIEGGKVFKVTAPPVSERRPLPSSAPQLRMPAPKAPRSVEVRPSGRLIPQFRNVVQVRKPPTEEELLKQW